MTRRITAPFLLLATLFVFGCATSPAPELAAIPPDAANFVTTVTVAGWPGGAGTPGSPRCESARSDAAESSCSSLSQESLSPPARAAPPPTELAAVRSVTAPARWNRVTRNGLVVYVR